MSQYSIGYAVFQEENPHSLECVETIRVDDMTYIALFPFRIDAEKHIKNTKKRFLNCKQYIKTVDLSTWRIG